MAGHLGRKKTAHRVLQRFYWPGIFRDVQDHCRTCEQCQKSAPRERVKAPHSFTHHGRALQTYRNGHSLSSPTNQLRQALHPCHLRLCHSLTEAIALRTVHASAIAKELLKCFAGMGVPEEILTDQDTNFTSQMLAEVYRLLRIKPIRTTPYHPQTDGLVERLNGTLKAMLQRQQTTKARTGIVYYHTCYLPIGMYRKPRQGSPRLN